MAKAGGVKGGVRDKANSIGGPVGSGTDQGFLQTTGQGQANLLNKTVGSMEDANKGYLAARGAKPLETTGSAQPGTLSTKGKGRRNRDDEDDDDSVQDRRQDRQEHGAATRVDHRTVGTAPSATTSVVSPKAAKAEAKSASKIPDPRSIMGTIGAPSSGKGRTATPATPPPKASAQPPATAPAAAPSAAAPSGQTPTAGDGSAASIVAAETPPRTPTPTPTATPAAAAPSTATSAAAPAPAAPAATTATPAPAAPAPATPAPAVTAAASPATPPPPDQNASLRSGAPAAVQASVGAQTQAGGPSQTAQQLSTPQWEGNDFLPSADAAKTQQQQAQGLTMATGNNFNQEEAQTQTAPATSAAPPVRQPPRSVPPPPPVPQPTQQHGIGQQNQVPGQNFGKNLPPNSGGVIRNRGQGNPVVQRPGMPPGRGFQPPRPGGMPNDAYMQNPAGTRGRIPAGGPMPPNPTPSTTMSRAQNFMSNFQRGQTGGGPTPVGGGATPPSNFGAGMRTPPSGGMGPPPPPGGGVTPGGPSAGNPAASSTPGAMPMPPIGG